MKRHVGRVLLDAAPFIYDAPRIQRIIAPDGTTDMVILHSGRAQAAGALKTPEIQDIYDLSMGSYDVVVDVGPAYRTRREEAFEKQAQLAAQDKTGEIFKVAGDLIIENSDMPGSKQIAQRIRRAMPPSLTADDPTDPKVQLQNAKSTIQQLEAQNQELMKQNAQMIDTIKTEQVQQNVKLEVVKIQTAAQVEVAGLNAKLEQAKLDFAKFELLHSTAHEQAMGAVAAAQTPEGGDESGATEGGEVAAAAQNSGNNQAAGGQVNGNAAG